MRGQTDKMRATLNNGAEVYVCGSKNALAESIPQILSDTLGAEGYASFIARNGLKMDVY